MCGIVAVVGAGDRTREIVLDGLDRLEYRGYDSAGLAIGDDTLHVRRRAGPVADPRAVADAVPAAGSVGIGHTRWSTHGPPTEANAHPQVDCTDRVAVVHNGVIENAPTLRQTLDAAGHSIEGETDTAVVPHLIEDALAEGHDPTAAVRAATDRLDGQFAFVVAIAGFEGVVGVRRGSPLVVGIDAPLTLASDVPAIRPFTDRVCHLADGDVVCVRPDGYAITAIDGTPRERPVETVDWESGATGLGAYDSYMRKEIDEQPRVLGQALAGRIDGDRVDSAIDGDRVTLDSAIDDPSEVLLVAAGSSHRAASVAARRFRAASVPAQAAIASEVATDPPPIDDALVVAVTQSGETADTLAALAAVTDRAATTVAVTNAPHASISRAVDFTLPVRAGPEVSVAATKSVTASLVTLELLVQAVTGPEQSVLDALRALPDQVQHVLAESAAASVARSLTDGDSYVFLGRGLQVPIAKEGALKTTELTYAPAQGFPAGEFKHGPLALVSESTPVIALVTGDGVHAEKCVTNVREIASRGAPIVAITDGRTDAGDPSVVDHTLSIPAAPQPAAAILATVQTQLLAYHLARELDRPIDRPRHLAKSVTVE
ncbi:glutamine--fructose-6-phosphate transaminase (isomerizing) [Halococcoides cellulosivorans]|uniref:glutamine--fructose-6-phosphate transaminase (isomerizing) n=1 Tax=Halococcoides cellulosivorans TaxID=1679096 RepID=A0A2R4WYK4_9EURY|nr:glutamine--fructose-6-phosphate transaminase (isomerizing) [Halococcoides cellulosivorans]AWB26633.1 glutamine--fructose-6-phosphate transaminase (isomerizing) [Halococcoides cellulosivorans]